MNFGVPMRAAAGSSNNKIAKISAWIRTKISTLNYLHDDPTIQILIQELECNDPGCVPLEVLVALLGKDARWTTKILKPLTDVVEDDVTDDSTMSYPSSWSYWVECYGEFQLKKTRPELYTHVEAFCSALDPRWLMNATETERQTALRMIERVLLNNESSTTISATSSSIATMGSLGSTLVAMKSKVDSSSGSSSGTGSGGSSSSTGTGGVGSGSGSGSGSSSSSSSGSDSGSGNTEGKPGKPGKSHSSVVVPMPTGMYIPPPPAIPPPPPSGPPPSFSANPTLPSSAPFKSAAGGGGPPTRRHDKGVRPRGCPCCDPDNLDNIVDKMLFLDTPP